ncbi:hydroxymethylbilane synthase [Stenotrophomonas sp. 24(2023)]|uniref:hydroxymethylbilane synthase n=1 Tax=Stenotrophomonas sp. 24(2023) TaxID=3068324 RepID=UPI0027E02F8B|nr:hydroxymethylbilane synthase [Stenotrophomonas sp. 24(2023)]WMJ70594.1 hydroxymethylbilane synthase [Stenotrophomonas sp. 24(2023)]
METVRIATRKSPLALWQSEYVAGQLRQAHPGLHVELVPMSTRGDEVLDRSLAAIGGKGLFLKELELAIQRGEADCAVHSLKDVPMDLDAPFALPAILPRHDPADGFISNLYAALEVLPPGARVGTSSLRRQAQLRALRPDLQLLDLRGNINTRLAKLDNGGYDAIVLAVAGLERLGLGNRIVARLQPPAWLPAPAQGAVAVECDGGNARVMALFAALDHAPTRSCVEAERAMNRSLHGSCHVPVAAIAQWQGSDLHLQGLVGSAGDGRAVRADAVGPGSDPDALGQQVARLLLERGADTILAELSL